MFASCHTIALPDNRPILAVKLPLSKPRDRALILGTSARDILSVSKLFLAIPRKVLGLLRASMLWHKIQSCCRLWQRVPSRSHSRSGLVMQDITDRYSVPCNMVSKTCLKTFAVQ